MEREITKKEIFFKLSDFNTIRWNLWTHLLFLDVVGAIILFADPYFQGDCYSNYILNILLPIIVILNIWAIIITFNVKKHQLLYELCIGIIYLIISIVFLLGTLKFLKITLVISLRYIIFYL